ncbi:MAG: hypothetical protein AAFU57_04960 [Bacteroidota bacterium]
MIRLGYSLLIFSLILIGCNDQIDYKVNHVLLSAINEHISECESEAKSDSTFIETDIYLVVMSTSDGDLIEVGLFQNTYYLQENLDGYMQIGDNKVFFYKSHPLLVDEGTLSREGLEDIPNENSELAEIAYDPNIKHLKFSKDDLE